MPYADSAAQQLPFQSGSDTSHDAAVVARGKSAVDRETLRYHYRRHPAHGVTDHEMHALTGLEINVINARRNELPVIKVGRRRGPKGVNVTAWALGPAR